MNENTYRLQMYTDLICQEIDEGIIKKEDVEYIIQQMHILVGVNIRGGDNHEQGNKISKR